MDGMTLHLLARLDTIRETQLRQVQLLESILEAIAKLRGGSSPPKTWPGFSKSIVAGGAQWVGGILALAYLARGGDVGTAMAFLQKLF